LAAGLRDSGLTEILWICVKSVLIGFLSFFGLHVGKTGIVVFAKHFQGVAGSQFSDDLVVKFSGKKNCLTLAIAGYADGSAFDYLLENRLKSVFQLRCRCRR